MVERELVRFELTSLRNHNASKLRGLTKQNIASVLTCALCGREGCRGQLSFGRGMAAVDPGSDMWPPVAPPPSAPAEDGNLLMIIVIASSSAGATLLLLLLACCVLRSNSCCRRSEQAEATKEVDNPKQRSVSRRHEVIAPTEESVIEKARMSQRLKELEERLELAEQSAKPQLVFDKARLCFVPVKDEKSDSIGEELSVSSMGDNDDGRRDASAATKGQRRSPRAAIDLIASPMHSQRACAKPSGGRGRRASLPSKLDHSTIESMAKAVASLQPTSPPRQARSTRFRSEHSLVEMIEPAAPVPSLSLGSMGSDAPSLALSVSYRDDQAAAGGLTASTVMTSSTTVSPSFTRSSASPEVKAPGEGEEDDEDQEAQEDKQPSRRPPTPERQQQVTRCDAEGADPRRCGAGRRAWPHARAAREVP